MSAIRLKRLRKVYTERRRGWRASDSSPPTVRGDTMVVLDGIDLTIEKGELVCILGPSGCGKSTLLRIVAGFEEATEGTVLVGGSAVDGPSSDNIFVFQHSGLFPWLTVAENTALGLRKLEDPEERRSSVEEFVDLVGLDGAGDMYPHQLSGGMQRRAELARALAVNPAILFMDEPFSGLDFVTKLRLREEILNMHEMLEMSLLFVTHDIDEAVIMADHLVVLSDKPSTLKLDQRIDFTHPRDFTKDPDLAALRRDLYRSMGVHAAI